MKLLALAVAVALCAPATAQWSTDSLSTARSELAATSVGSIALFAGGRHGPGDSAVVDLFDSATGTWSTATLSKPQCGMVAASAGGQALFMGKWWTLVDVFDSVTSTWSTTEAPSTLGQGAATSAGDKVLFGGGGAPAFESDRVHVYDTVSGTWSIEYLSQARYGLAATSVGSLALFAGGEFSVTASVPVSTVDILDTATNTWSTASLSQPRSKLAATSVGGKALFAGGDGSDRVDIYDAASGTWSQASLSQARSDLTATAVGPFAIFAGGQFAGAPASTMSDRVDIYNSEAGTWSAATLSEARSRLASTAVGNRAFFAGGETAGSTYSDVVDLFAGPTGTAYCPPAVPNSTGMAGLLRAAGSTFIAAGDVTLIAEQLPPGQFGYFITGLTQGFIQPPGGEGTICLSGNIGRYNRTGEIIQGPVGSLQLDLTSMPVNPLVAVQPGDTWNFQCWYRDLNPTLTSNTTNGVAVTFATTGAPSAQFAVTQASVVEDSTQLEVRVTLSQPTDEDVLLTYATDGTATVEVDWRVEETNPFVIPAGETWADMTIIVAEDGEQESDELAIVLLGAPVGAVLGTQPTFTLTIVDDD